MSIDELFAALWESYAAVTPQAPRIQELLRARGETITNDHVALRTFGVPGLDIEDIDRAFVSAGYEPAESYEFPDKHLIACHYEHDSRPLPKVFISSLMVTELSESAQQIVGRLCEQVTPGTAAHPLFVASGRPWEVSYADYEQLAEESEYAAWLSAYGFRANHFTVDVGSLTTFKGLAELNAFLQGEGFALNDAGGAIKGSPENYLEQSSTRADEFTVPFSDVERSVPSCYYEFARRYPLPDGTLFQGFVPGSADKLFESTDRR